MGCKSRLKQSQHFPALQMQPVPLEIYPTGKLFLSSSSFSCQQTSSSCLVTFPSIPIGLLPFLEVVHNNRKDKVVGEGEQVLSV